MNNTQDIMEHLARLSRMIRRRPTTGQHLSRGSHRLVGILLQSDGLRTTELAESLDIRPASLTELLKRLEEEGYVRREKDEKDSRVVHVYVTPKARQEHEKREVERREQGKRMMEVLTPQEAETFCEICDKLCAFLEEEYPAQGSSRHGHGPGRGGKTREVQP